MFARRAGAQDDRPPVMVGSHLDSQPLGGKFDGAYGVLAGLEIVRTLNDAGIRTEAPIEVVNWTDEEGARFSAGMGASGAFCGLLNPATVLEMEDSTGRSVGEELVRIGYAGTAPIGGRPLDSFFEAHIEQGPLLEAADLAAGIVTGAQAQRCFQVTVTGEEGHAGTVPMDRRRDALLGAARMVDALARLAFDFEPWPVITVAAMAVRPNARNTIAGEVTFTIDSRHPHDDTLAQIDAAMEAACSRVAAAGGLEVAFEQTSGRTAVTFDPDRVELLRRVASELAIPTLDLYSGAGHDACNLAQVTPSAMVFVRCAGGISHNERESADAPDLAAGADLLLHAILARAGATGAD
jgi:N-carbamoyl-L-amino-acid hydrolase